MSPSPSSLLALTAEVVSAMPGRVALVSPAGISAASPCWRDTLGLSTESVRVEGEVSLLEALCNGKLEGKGFIEKGKARQATRWSARQVSEEHTAWLVLLETEQVTNGEEGRFRSIFNTTFQFTGMLAPDGTLLEANDAALRFGGLSRADVIGRKVWDCYWFGVSENLREQIRRDVVQAAAGTFVRHEYVVWGAHETLTPIDFSIIPVSDDAGRVTHLIPEGRDISDLYLTREALREQTADAERFSAQLERLYRIGTTPYDTTDALLRDVLNIGCDVLGMPVGGVNVFEGSRCRYQAVVPADAPIQVGNEQPLADALCLYVHDAVGTVCEHNLNEIPERHGHFAYREQGVRAYVGTPLHVNGTLYGALFFADLEPHVPFQPHDVEMVELMARRIERAVEQNQAHKALRETKDRLLLAQRMAHLGSWQWNANTDMVTWSDEVYHIFGLEPGEPVDFGKYAARIHPDDGAELQSSVQQALADLSGYAFNHRVVQPDGTVRHVQSMAEVSKDENGSVIITGTVQDVTERVKADEALRESERRYRFIAENATDIIGRHRPDGTSTYVSPAVRTVLGREPEEVVGMSPASLLHPEDVETVATALAVVSSTDPQTLRFRLQHGGDGHWVWLEARWQPIFNDKGEVAELVSSIRDVSEQVDFERVLRRREARLRLLTRIASEAALDTNEQVRRALRLATEELGMDVGVLARKKGGHFTVRAVHAPDLALQPGSTYAVSDNDLLVGPDADEVVAISDLEAAGLSHPAYTTFGHRAYVGVPIRVKGAFFGSLSFWCRTPLDAFAAEDREFVQLLGIWMSALLEKAGAEAQVRNSRNQLNSLLNSSLDGIMAFTVLRDAAGEIADFEWVLANTRSETLTGYSIREIVGKRLLLEMPGNKESGLFDAYKNVVATGLPYHAELPYNHEGIYKWFNITAVKLGDGFFVTFRDVSDVREAVDALRESEERFRLLAENASDLVCVLEPEGTFTYVSPSSVRILGFRADELVGKSAYELCHPDDVAHLQREGYQAARSGETATTTYRMRTSAGEYIWLETVMRPGVAAEGAVDRIQTASRDVTDRVQAERELARANQVLQQRNRELQDFAYVASHDLQEPLRKIRAFADLLLQDNSAMLDEEGRQYLDRIDDAATRMAQLISDLLAFSRVTTKGNPFQQVDLAAVINDMLADLEIALAESGGTVALGDLPRLEADPMQMRQLFQNLIGNALKFRQPGMTPHVEVRAHVQKAQENELVVIEVADNGIGFDEKYLDRIFTPFQRLHGRQHFTGTGMGLAICRRIIERHQGQITARSAPGQGTTFIITLPRTHHQQIAS